MFSPNRAWHNRPNRTENVPRPLWRSLPFAVRLQLIGMSTDSLLLHATKLPTDAWLLPKSCSTGWALAAGHAPSCSQGFVFWKAFGQGEHLIHHETQGGVCNLSIVAPALTFPQSKISTAFPKNDLYVPASFVKFKGSDEVHGGICSKQHFPMGASPIFDDEDAYGLFA